MRLLLQFPEGLKQKADEMKSDFERQGHEVFLSASACYGACDIAIDEAKAIEADKIIHVGHSRFIRKDLPVEVEYIEYRVDIDPSRLEAVLPLLEGARTIALGTTIQHAHQLEDIKRFFRDNGIEALIGRGRIASEPGQVLGCDGSAVTSLMDKADAALYIGSGMFHPLAITGIEGNVGACGENNKPVIAFNPYTGTATDLRNEISKLERRRRGALASALTSRRFGILLSTKPGQFNLKGAITVRDKLREKGLQAGILVANELDPLSIQNFLAFDCLVNTACPRIADDSERFGMPVLSLDMIPELLSMLERR